MPHVRLLFVAFCLIAAPCIPQAVSAQEHGNPRVTDTVKLVRKILPAVVSVRVVRPGGKPSVIEYGHGGGSVIHEDGYILTNNHVVTGAKKIEVAFFQGEWQTVRLIARLSSEDLALLKIDSDKPRPTLPLGRSEDLELGEPVITIGSAGGLPHTLSTGIVSGLGRATNTEHAHLPSMVQTTAPISGGSSGGALINALGQQIGVITSRKSDGENLGFAITVDRVREVFPALINAKARFGIFDGLGIDPHAKGAQVIEVVNDSPAQKAGLHVGDVIRRVGEQKIKSGVDWQLALVAAKAGDSLSLTVQRGEEQITIPMTISATDLPSPQKVDGLKAGLRVQRFAGQWENLPDFSAMQPKETFVTPQVRTSDQMEMDNYADVFSGFLRVPREGYFTFAIRSDDGSRLYIGDRLVADNDGCHPEKEVAGAMRMKPGDYPIRVEFFEASGDQMLRLHLEEENGARKELPAEWLFHAP